MNQKDIVLEHINKYGTITPLEALTRYGIMRLAARVSELRTEGFNVVTDLKVHDDRRYASYSMAPGRLQKKEAPEQLEAFA